MNRRLRPGDRFLVDACTTTDWRTAHQVTVTARRVTKLGCGCSRIEAERPGPANGPLAGDMHLLEDRCLFHQTNHAGYGAESQLIHPREATR